MTPEDSHQFSHQLITRRDLFEFKNRFIKISFFIFALYFKLYCDIFDKKHTNISDLLLKIICLKNLINEIKKTI